MTSIQSKQNTITIQQLYKWDSEESQMNYLNLYPSFMFTPVIDTYFIKHGVNVLIAKDMVISDSCQSDECTNNCSCICQLYVII